MTIEEIRPYQNKTVILNLSNGEITTAKILLVFDEEEGFVVHVIGTNRADTYRKADSAYAIAAADLVSVEEVSE